MGGGSVCGGGGVKGIFMLLSAHGSLELHISIFVSPPFPPYPPILVSGCRTHTQACTHTQLDLSLVSPMRTNAKGQRIFECNVRTLVLIRRTDEKEAETTQPSQHTHTRPSQSGAGWKLS